ncbi:hypothetical protein MHU86_2727 [Fragilaria crotonensis]|nr:hypothetical protein MHU86_2727 [Fragilaria crotonensis]
MDPSEFTSLQKTCKDLHDSIFAYIFNLPFHPSSTKLKSYSYSKQHQQCQEETKEPPTIIHPSHPGLESEIASFIYRIASFSHLPTLTEFSDYLQHHYDLEDLVKVAIRMTGDEQLMPILDLLLVVRNVIGRLNANFETPEDRLLDIQSKFERIPTDGSRGMTVQNFPPSPPRILMAFGNSADSRAKTLTCHDRSAELGTRNFCAKTPDSVQTPLASPPQSPDNRRIHSPCYPETPSPRPNFNDHSATDAPTRPFSPSAPHLDDSFELDTHIHFAPRFLTAAELASESYCADDDTVNASTVVDSTVAYSSPPRWAYRAHNPTDPSLSSASLSVQHPVAIKLEDLPRSPASDCADVGENYYSPSDNSPTKPSVNFYPASDPVPDPEILPEVEIMPEPMIIEIIEEEFLEEGATNPILEALNELPEPAIQQSVRMLPSLFPEPPLRHLNPLAQVHQRPYAMFQDPAHHPSSALMFSEATLDNPLNGTIHLRDLPLCIKISTTIAAFCLNFLAAPPEVHHIRDITSPDMKPMSRHITLRHQMPSPTSPLYSRDDKFYLLGMIHTLNRATNLLTQHFTDEQRSLLTFGIPDKYYDITRDFYENPPYCPMETKCAVGLIYALRLYYITHHRHSTYHRHGFRQRDLYPKHMFQEVPEYRLNCSFAVPFSSNGAIVNHRTTDLRKSKVF